MQPTDVPYLGHAVGESTHQQKNNGYGVITGGVPSFLSIHQLQRRGRACPTMQTGGIKGNQTFFHQASEGLTKFQFQHVPQPFISEALNGDDGLIGRFLVSLCKHVHAIYRDFFKLYKLKIFSRIFFLFFLFLLKT